MVEDTISRGQGTGDREQISDSELLRRYVEEKSEVAFAELVQRHLDLVYSAALRRLGGDAHAAGDAAQQVFIALARQAAALTRCAVLPGWLYATTRNVAVDFVRAEQRRRAREQEAQAMHELTSPPATDATWEQMRPLLDATMDELSDAEREIVVLRFFAKRPFADIGAALKLTDDAARMRVERALEKLHILLGRRGITSTAAALTTVLANQAVVAAPAGLMASVTSGALASADGATATALNFVQFMSTTKFVASAAVIIGLLALGTAGYKVHARNVAEASLAVARQDYEMLVAKSRDLAQRAKAAEQEAADFKARAESASPIRAAAMARATDVTAGPKPGATWNPVQEGYAFLERHPEVKQAIFDDGNAMTNFKYGPLFESLGLTPAQIKQFQDIVREGWLTTTAITEDGKSGVLSYKTGLSRNEVNVRVSELLGVEGFQEYQKFRATVGARVYTAQLAAALCFSEAPLTGQQSAQLTEIINGGVGRLGNWADADAAVIDSTSARGRSIFSASQLPAWEAMVETWRTNMAGGQALRARGKK